MKKFLIIEYMASLRKFVTVSFTSASFFAGSIGCLLNSASAGELLFDKNCRNYPRVTENFKSPAPSEATSTFKTLDFIANRQKYFLTVLRDRNGAAVFCIAKDAKHYILNMKRLSNAEKIQSKYVYQIVKASKNNPEFTIALRDGSDRAARTTVYKLNLQNPDRPVIVQLGRSN